MQNSHSGFIKNTTGVLLAGGKSLRMGDDKARIEIDGSPLLGRALDLLCHYFSPVLIAGDRPDLIQAGWIGVMVIDGDFGLDLGRAIIAKVFEIVIHGRQSRFEVREEPEVSETLNTRKPSVS